MGGGSSAPAFAMPDIGQNLALMGGKDLEAYAKNQLLNGMDAKQRAMLEGQAAGNLRSGEQQLREQFASMGNTPIGAQVGAQTNLRTGIGKNLADTLLQGDMSAKQAGFNNWTQLGNMAMGISNAKNQYGLESYKINEENKFKWGDFLGSLLGAGGSALGGWLSRGK